jgi:predicted Fe-Mo cluster-binding NifX family protein
MNICIPIEENLGMKSRMCLHFGTAPKFVIVDTDTLMFEVVDNPDRRRLMRFLRELKVGSVVVGGIGLSALDELHAADIAVYSSGEDTIEEIVHAFNTGTINPVTLGAPCHRKGGGRSFAIPSCGLGTSGRGGASGRGNGDCSGDC